MFIGVTGDTRVVFSVVLRNDAVAGLPGPRRVRARVVFRAAGRSILGSELIEIVIPGDEHDRCGT